ncbi:MAG: hypothetical protein R6U96_05440 [Promethearchaeia archaeon]
MRVSKRKIAIVIIAAIIGSLFLIYPFLNEQFPDNGTVNRDIWFMKSTNNETPYFIIKDDIITKKGMEVEWIQHGRENLTLDEDAQSWNFTANDDFEGNEVKLYGRIITSEMSFQSGESFATSGADQTAPYLIADTNGPQQISTLLFPLNESMTLPKVDVLKNDKNQTCFQVHHEETYDIFWSRFPQQQGSLTKEVEGWTADAETFYLRANNTNHLFSLGFQKATKLQEGEDIYFHSTEKVSGSFSISNTELSGQLEVINPCTIKLRMPEPESIEVNGDPHLYDYSNGLVTIHFSEPGNYTLGGQYENVAEIEVEDHEVISAERCLDKIQDLTHPYLLYEEEDIDNVLSKLHSSNPLNSFYNSLNETTETSEDLIFKDDGTLTYENVSHPIMRRGLIGWVLHYYEGDKSALEKIKLVLANLMDYHYSSKQTLDSALMSYGAIIAYDAVYQNLTEKEQEQYAQNLKEFVVPLAEPHDITPLNNHLAVNMNSVGLVGMVTQDKDLLQIALDETETFISEETVDGIPIESFNYAHFGFQSLMPFLYAMNRLNLVDYLKENGKVERFYERTLDMLSPTGVYPHYEDASDGARQALWLRSYSHLTENNKLRQKIAHFYHIQNQSSFINVRDNYLYLELFCWQNLSTAPESPPQNRLSWLSNRGGNGALRSSWNKSAVFVSFNAKTYHQSHTHLDEMSYEIYAYGAMLSMNIGYPGWKKEHHADCVSTFGSNLIRLNNHDQLQETCNGFGFHAFSANVDIVTMEGGDIYRSPFSFKINPILYIITALLQIGFLCVAIYLFFIILRDSKTRTHSPMEKEPGKEIEENENHNQLSFRDKIFKTLGQPKWLMFVLLYIGTFFRLFAFSYSILRKMEEWAYTQDYQMIATVNTAIWAALFILPFITSVLLLFIGRKIKRRILDKSTEKYHGKAIAFNQRFMHLYPILIAITILFDVVYFIREHTLMDYLSKDFGTLIAFSYDLVNWALFQLVMLSLIFAVVLFTFFYLFRDFNSRKFKSTGITLSFSFLVLFTLWFLLTLALYLWINSFTIETWFA